MVRHQAALAAGKLTRVTSGVNLPSVIGSHYVSAADLPSQPMKLTNLEASHHALRHVLLLPGPAVAQPRGGRAPGARAVRVDGGARLRLHLADRAPLHRVRPG